MLHALMYQGAYERNYPTLAPGTSTYVSTDGSVRPLRPWPPEVDGVRIGYMERAGKKFFAVRLQFEEHDIVLQSPLPIDPIRHMGSRRFSAAPTVLPDDCASDLLDDVIAANPDQNTELALLLNRVNQVRRGNGPIV